MRRRYIGAVVMALVLVAAVVVRSTRDTTVAGSAAAVPVTTAPAVGDCLVEPVSRIGVLTSQANQPVFPHFALGACSGRHDGEVIAVVDHRFTVPADALSAFAPYEQWCDPALSAWTGRPATTRCRRSTAPAPTGWRWSDTARCHWDRPRPEIGPTLGRQETAGW